MVRLKEGKSYLIRRTDKGLEEKELTKYFREDETVKMLWDNDRFPGVWEVTGSEDVGKDLKKLEIPDEGIIVTQTAEGLKKLNVKRVPQAYKYQKDFFGKVSESDVTHDATHVYDPDEVYPREITAMKAVEYTNPMKLAWSDNDSLYVARSAHGNLFMLKTREDESLTSEAVERLKGIRDKLAIQMAVTSGDMKSGIIIPDEEKIVHIGPTPGRHFEIVVGSSHNMADECERGIKQTVDLLSAGSKGELKDRIKKLDASDARKTSELLEYIRKTMNAEKQAPEVGTGDRIEPLELAATFESGEWVSPQQDIDWGSRELEKGEQERNDKAMLYLIKKLRQRSGED
ncbi:MAG: hypothetical protein V1921_01195 [Candidatus Altiarchaeota archaeon]